MHASKRKKLEAAGYRVGDAADFLGLSPEEAALIDMKVKLSIQLVELRKKARISQLPRPTRGLVPGYGIGETRYPRLINSNLRTLVTSCDRGTFFSKALRRPSACSISMAGPSARMRHVFQTAE